MPAQNCSETAHQAPPATPARKDWREIYARKRAQRNDTRYLRVGRTHEDVNEAKLIWRAKIETATESAVGKAQEQRLADVPTTVATPNVSRRASPPTVAYAGARGAWPKSHGTWEGGFLGVDCNAGETIKAGGGSLKYLVGRDFSGPSASGSCEEAELATADAMGNDGFLPGLEIAREVHHRTPSTSTASSSSLRTMETADWWQENSPWAWQWAIESQKDDSKVTTEGSVVEGASLKVACAIDPER